MKKVYYAKALSSGGTIKKDMVFKLNEKPSCNLFFISRKSVLETLGFDYGELICAFNKCAHLNFGNWEIIEKVE